MKRREKTQRGQESPSAQNFMYRLCQYIFTQGVGCIYWIIQPIQLLSQRTRMYCIRVVCTYCFDVTWLRAKCTIVCCVSAVDFNAKLSHTTQHNTIQSAIRWVIHTHKNHTLDTNTHTRAQETSSANDSSLLIISKQMRTNGKSCYHRYVIEKEEHAYLWENEYISRRAITQARVFFITE